jgi:hypothetical protein
MMSVCSVAIVMHEVANEPTFTHLVYAKTTPGYAWFKVTVNFQGIEWDIIHSSNELLSMASETIK